METIHIPASVGGLNYNFPSELVADNEMTDCRNVRIEKGQIRKRPGYDTLGNNTPLPGVPIGATPYYLFSGTEHLISFTTKAAFRYVANGTYWETINVSEVEDNCETTWTASSNVTCSDEGTIKKVGTYSQKIASNANFTTGLMAYHNSAIGDKSAYGMARFWIYSSKATTAGQIQFCIDNTAGCGSPLETLDIPALTAETWKLCFLLFSDASALTSIASLGIKAASATTSYNIYIDDIQFVKIFDSSVTYNTTSEYAVYSDHIRALTESDNWLVFTNGVDAPRKWTGTGVTSDLIGVMPAGITALLAKGLVQFKSHLMLWDTTEDGTNNPQRIRWSDSGLGSVTPANFNTGDAGYQDIMGNDKIVACVRMKGDYLAVLKERSVWLGYATGTTDVFQFDLKNERIGCIAPKSVANMENDVVFLGQEDVYRFDGITCESLCDKKNGSGVRKELFSYLNPAQIKKSFSFVDIDKCEYWLLIPYSTQDYCKIAWCYNYRYGAWTRHEFNDYVSCACSANYTNQIDYTLGDFADGITIGQQLWRLGERTARTSNPVMILGAYDGDIFQISDMLNNDDGTAIDAWFDTKDATTSTTAMHILNIDSYYIGAGLDVYYSYDNGASWTSAGNIDYCNNLATPNRLNLRDTENRFRFRFRNDDDEPFSFVRSVLYALPAGERIE